MKSPNLLYVVFLFGLIHGFGLSTRLQQLPLGEDMSGLILRILSFNVGVEFGQIAALVIMLAIISGWRKTSSFTQFSTISNAGLIAAGLVLFFMQMHGFGHMSYSDEFALNKDDHYHTHLVMEAKKVKTLSEGLMNLTDVENFQESNNIPTSKN